MSNKDIYITKYDMERLRRLIEINLSPGGSNSAYLEKLEDELDRAHVVDPREVPEDVITMNSKVILKCLDTGEEKIFWLVFPDKADSSKNLVSILAPIGTAMIGYREGDVFEWQVPAGTRKFEVIEVLYQPERLGNFQL